MSGAAEQDELQPGQWLRIILVQFSEWVARFFPYRMKATVQIIYLSY
jgi:hypothetical protein